MVHKHGI